MVVGPIIGPILGSPEDLGVRPRQHPMGLGGMPEPRPFGLRCGFSSRVVGMFPAHSGLKQRA